MLVSMVFCYAQWCADKTTSVMKTLEREGKRKEDLQPSSMKSAGPTEGLWLGQPFWEESWQLREPSQVGSVPKQPIRCYGAVAYQ